MSFVTDKCFQAKTGQIERKWYAVDADGLILGRMATKLATVLMGKNKPTYTPHIDTGDFVVVTNAEKVKVTGSKAQSMFYDRYSYHPGGRKVTTYREMQVKHPDRIIKFAVRRMLPKSAMGKRLLTKLKVYSGPDHPHHAQQCEVLDLGSV